MRFIFVTVVTLALAGLGASYFWLEQRFDLPAPTVDLDIEPGTSVRGIAKAVAEAGAPVNPDLLYWWFRLSGQSRQIKAGSYELTRDTTPRNLLQKLVHGDETLGSVTIVEGWTFRQMQNALAKAEHLRPESQALSQETLMRLLGRPGLAPEGRFFPDTYTYRKGSSDVALLQRALRAMDKKLAAAWALRDPDSPLQTPEQALTLASIVEKETASPDDRATIAAVFCNRLRIGMRLQTDPSVIYGMKESFDGNLRKKDLQTDTPWNTYTRSGLPPTPIAMAGKAALLAAVRPAPSTALYFVARGDGTSQFSNTLEEHNRAVNQYQRAQRARTTP